MNSTESAQVHPWDEEDEIDITELEKIFDESDQNKNVSRLRNEEQFFGFDGNVGDTWIYPNNLPCRTYQQSIAQAALYKNTLVVLPTGLGKTFIAAVVMYNFYRWYPRGRVIFMAPTRPLVAQQIGACQKIMAFPVQDTVDITGKVRREKRMEYWRTKRVFFATPQVVQADMCPQSELEEPFPFGDIKLLVVDEAHKARGRYAYTEVVQQLWRKNRYFRVLALSATPGRTVEDVADVVRNLFISHLEVRWDNSIDVVTYVHQRSMRKIVVPLGEKIKSIREELINIIDPYLRQLIDAGVVKSSHQHITRNGLLFEQKRFREHSFHERHPQQTAVNSNFSICISLFHSLELLERHGLRVFINSFEDDEEGRPKFSLALNPALRDLITRLREELGPNPFDISAHAMTNGRLPEMPADLDFGHPKFQKARECLLEHFEKNPESRAIVFCEYRESVMLMYRLLLQHMPLLKPRCFVGQGGTTGPLRALSQKQQIQIMEDFRVGKSNILIATSIGEEGIDVGEVDLIVCFDISTSNPTRFIQRIGRTGRQRKGYVVMLVTEGREQQLLKDVLANKDQINRKILNSYVVQSAFYKESPRLVPTEYSPKCVQTFIKPHEHEAELDGMEIKSKKSDSKQKEKKTAMKGSKSKQKTIENTQDLRNFFKKSATNVGDKDVEIFELPSTEIVTQSTAERSIDKVKSLFKGLNMNLLAKSSTQLLETQNIAAEKPQTPKPTPKLDTKAIKRLNRLLKSSNDLVPLSQRKTGLFEKLKSSNFSRSGKLFLLKRRYKEVRDYFEKYLILQALEEDNNMSVEELGVRETCQCILTLFTDREALERFLEDAEYESRIPIEPVDNISAELAFSTENFDRALDKIFTGLDPQGVSWDSFDYRQEELKKTNYFKELMAKQSECTKEEDSNADFNSIVFDGKPSDTTTQFDEITITDSKYASQWQEEFQSTDNVCKESPLRDQTADKSTLLDDTLKRKHEVSYDSAKNRVPKKSTATCGPLFKAFERQKCKEAARRSFEAELMNINTPIKIDSDDDDIFFVPLSNESLTKEDKKPCDKMSNYTTTCTSTNFKLMPIANSPVPKDELQKKIADLPRSTQNIETSFMSCQQSTPIPNKSWNKKPNITDTSLQQDLEINLDDFLEPFPEELELSSQKPETLSGSSLKENAQPNSTKTPTTSDLFRLLEAKPTNSVMSPKIISKISKSNASVTPNSPIYNSPKFASPLTTLGSPKNRPSTMPSTKKYETSPSIMSTFTKGVKRLESIRSAASNLSKQTTTGAVSTSTSSIAIDVLDSPITRKPHKDVNLKRKIIESETESEATPTTVCQRDSDSDFEEITATQQPKKRCLSQRRDKRLRRARLCEFFDQEADKSDGPGHTSDEDDGENTENTSANFVCDSVIVEDDDHDSGDEDERPTGTQMQAVYLQSLKSPQQRRGGFKIPAPREFAQYEDIYSQELPMQESQYVDDSFVVGERDATVHPTLCPLERAEMILKKRKRQAKKRRFAEVGVINATKKPVRKCYQLQDDSDTSDGGG